ncbi:hypothetical protein ACLOJK_022378 [Asimina triloba]
MISIWNFLGHIGGGYSSKIIERGNTYPRPIAIAVAQIVMAIRHFFFAMAWPGTMTLVQFRYQLRRGKRRDYRRMHVGREQGSMGQGRTPDDKDSSRRRAGNVAGDASESKWARLAIIE